MSTESHKTELHERPEQSPGTDSPSSASFEDLEKGRTHHGLIADEVEVMRDRWVRAEAETANVRSRAKRDIEEAKQFAVQKFATDVVEAAENLRRGINNIPHETASETEIVTRLREGFRGVERSFIDLLKRNGIERHDPTGVPFDSERHQAISEQVSTAHAPGTVVHAATASWTLNGRLLRPAMVVVARSHDATSTEKLAGE